MTRASNPEMLSAESRNGDAEHPNNPFASADQAAPADETLNYEELVEQTKAWVQDNKGLAIVLLAGIERRFGIAHANKRFGRIQ